MCGAGGSGIPRRTRYSRITACWTRAIASPLPKRVRAVVSSLARACQPCVKLVTSFDLCESGDEPRSVAVDAVPSNATRGGNLALDCFCLPVKCCFRTFEVDAGKVQLVSDGRGKFYFYGQGVHRICDPFYKVGKSMTYYKGLIQHGDLTLCVVEQGQIGYALDQGQPVLLPPGLHQWRSPTMIFEKSFDLNNNVIRMGPLTLITVDSGYSAVTEDNGEQKILAGGSTYLLTHRNWKFQKYLPEKIQSSNLKRIEATSADNVLMAVDATVIWRITDVATAALNSAETIHKDGSDALHSELGNLTKLTNDVLKQAEASLAAFIGAVEYSATFNVAAAVATPPSAVPVVEGIAPPAAPVPSSAPPPSKITSPLFDLVRLQTCVDHANAVTATYGVTIISINVVAAVPADKTLMVSLAQGAVAAAEAQKFETVAAGKAAAAKIEAKGAAEAEVLKARGDADAERVRAEGHRAAAELISSNEVAVKLATIDHTGAALDKNKAFFFGADAKDIGSLLAATASNYLGGPSK
mmetsp:Transcript_60853/g.166814  ORF Transcript_60853/g.166814 Transcript_60853/m.166814 type:complete len:525 (+) Transcript_60853:147-1721(+)